MRLTDAQAAAMTRPCRLACEVLHPDLAWRVVEPPVTMILSINTGYE